MTERTDDLERALGLLKRLNGLVCRNGDRLSEQITVDGFEPWWWIQEQLFWGHLVPRVGGAESGVETAPPTRAIVRVATAALGIFALASAAAFRLLGRDTLLYTIDQMSPGLDHDFRVAPVYTELRRRGYRLAEVIHVANLRTTLRNLRRRRRPGLLIEPLVEMLGSTSPVPREPDLDLPPDDPDAAILRDAARVGLRLTQSARSRFVVLRAAVRLTGAKRLISLDDSRHGNEVVAACRSLGIPALGYMHGLMNRYHVGLMAFGFGRARRHGFDLYGLWSPYFLARTLSGDLYDGRTAIAMGPLRPPRSEDLAGALDPGSRGSIVRVLVVSEPRARQDEVAAYLARLSVDTRFEVTVKLRPGEHASPLIDALGGTAPRISQTATVYEAFRDTDVVVGSYATVLYEASLALKPTVMVRTSFSYGHDLATDRLCEWANTPDEMTATTLRAAALGRDELERRRDAIWGAGPTPGFPRLLDLAEQRLWTRP